MSRCCTSCMRNLEEFAVLWNWRGDNRVTGTGTPGRDTAIAQTRDGAVSWVVGGRRYAATAQDTARCQEGRGQVRWLALQRGGWGHVGGPGAPPSHAAVSGRPRWA